jgi:hypothetical protein
VAALDAFAFGELLFFDSAQRKGNQKKGRFPDQSSTGERVAWPFSDSHPALSVAPVGATSVAMEGRQPLTPDHNAVASKDKSLSPPSADPEGGAQDARRFPIESG